MIDTRDVEFREGQIVRIPIKKVECHWCEQETDIRDCREFEADEKNGIDIFYMCPNCQDSLIEQ